MQLSLTILFATLFSIFRSRAALELDNLALRHQIGILQRSARKRPKLTPRDRRLWVWFSRIWSDWLPALAIVKLETVVAWHRAGFRRFWKVRRGQPGRPLISREVRDLIRKMCRENPARGAPRIHGELMLNGVEAMRDAGGDLKIKSQLTEDGQLHISVTDNGVGLPAERADQIFNAFFTTKAHGTGMGLAITPSIVEIARWARVGRREP